MKEYLEVTINGVVYVPKVSEVEPPKEQPYTSRLGITPKSEKPSRE